MKIFLDFDGTMVEHYYPEIGRCNFGCFEVIKKLQDAGHEIILNTYRADCNDGTLEKALNYLNEDYWMFVKDDDFEMKPIVNYTKTKIHPNSWNLAEAIEIGELYIDDIAYNIPLKPSCMVNSKMVNWSKLDVEFEENGVYENVQV